MAAPPRPLTPRWGTFQSEASGQEWVKVTGVHPASILRIRIVASFISTSIARRPLENCERAVIEFEAVIPEELSLHVGDYANRGLYCRFSDWLHREAFAVRRSGDIAALRLSQCRVLAASIAAQ